MVRVKELKLSLRIFMKAYRWRVIDPVPAAAMTKPITECRVALVSSAGFVVPGDPPFDERVRGGDFSHRVIPANTDVQALEEHHRSDVFDHTGIRTDPNIALPLDRLHEMVAAGEIGSVAPRQISLMGCITAPGRLIRQTLPVLGDLLQEDEVDVALMVPV